MADQQYCLRWNNHQTTLISVFESLQERGCMVDCTLAAEGQSLQAHKVVLSACSPYLEDLLSKHYDKHPILLLKDVKFEELKAMMDYMYRGEVNVAQDKLSTFLRAAESLQIKGLSDGGTDPPDSGGTGSMKRTAKGAPVSVRSNQQLTVRTTNLADDNSSRDGSVSPSLRKRRRRRGSDGSDHDNSSNVADGKQSSAAAAPVTGPTVNNEDMLPTVPASGPSDDNLLSSILESTETENATDSGITSANNTVPLQENVIRDRDNVLIEPKTEYLDDDAQDLHLDDDDSMFRAGPSHARGSGNYEGDDGEDVYMANQDSGANAQDDAEPELVDLEAWADAAARTPLEEVTVPGRPGSRSPVRIPSSTASILGSPTKTMAYLSQLDAASFGRELDAVQLSSGQLEAAPLPVFHVAEAEDLLSAFDPDSAPSQGGTAEVLDPLNMSLDPPSQPSQPSEPQPVQDSLPTVAQADKDIDELLSYDVPSDVDDGFYHYLFPTAAPRPETSTGRSCWRCQAVFPDEKALLQHNLQMHAGRNHACDKCPETFITSACLAIHKRQVHTEDQDLARSKCANTLTSVSNGGGGSVVSVKTEALAAKLPEDQDSASPRRASLPAKAKKGRRSRKVADADEPDESDEHGSVVVNENGAVEKEYRCELCLREFRREKALEAHMNRHQDGYGYEAMRRRSNSVSHRFSLANSPADVKRSKSRPSSPDGAEAAQLRSTSKAVASVADAPAPPPAAVREPPLALPPAPSLALVPVPSLAMVPVPSLAMVPASSNRRSRRLSHLPAEVGPSGLVRNPFSTEVKIKLEKLDVSKRGRGRGRSSKNRFSLH